MNDERPYKLTISRLRDNFIYESDALKTGNLYKIIDDQLAYTCHGVAWSNAGPKMLQSLREANFREYIEPKEKEEIKCDVPFTYTVPKTGTYSVSFGDKTFTEERDYNDELISRKENPDTELNHGPQGISRRDYFAGMAMQGTLANPHCWESYTRTEIIKEALQMSNLLIKELDKESKDV